MEERAGLHSAVGLKSWMTWRLFGRMIAMSFGGSILSSAITGVFVNFFFMSYMLLAGHGPVEPLTIISNTFRFITVVVFYGVPVGILLAGIPTFFLGFTTKLLQTRCVYLQYGRIWIAIGVLFSILIFGTPIFLSEIGFSFKVFLLLSVAGGLNAFLFQLFASRWITFLPLKAGAADE